MLVTKSLVKEEWKGKKGEHLELYLIHSIVIVHLPFVYTMKYIQIS